jgi:hypothetical protein
VGFSRPATALAGLALAAMLPTVVFAGGPGYAIPRLASVTPLYARVRPGGDRAYSLHVFFSDGTTRSVTLDANTTWTQVGGTGTMGGDNNHIYSAPLNEGNDNVTVTGSYTQNGNTVSQNAHLEVRP